MSDLVQRFVTAVWKLQPGYNEEMPPHGFISHKDWETGQWTDMSVPATKPRVPDLQDLYFSPVLFRGKRRLADEALGSRWLYADLDAVDPEGLELQPTLAWETSPDRFQALWLMDRPLRGSSFESLNRRLTYHCEADKGGWSLTKVLRVPGSVSTKYGRSRAKRFEVALVGERGPKYKVQDLQRLVPKLERDNSRKRGFIFENWDELPERAQVLDEWRAHLPMRAKKLLATKTIVQGDDRSARLWELYNILLQAGMAPPEVLVTVQGTVWNKYAGQRRELAQLQIEIGKAATKHADTTEKARLQAAMAQPKNRLKGAVGHRLEKRVREEPDSLPYLTNSEFLRQSFPDPEWLVEGIWSKRAYGIWAGEFKAYKTVTLLDFAVSVASGVPFLGRFNVRDPGGVLYLHEEGQRGLIRDRLHRIEHNKGLAAKVGTNGNGEPVLEAPPDLEHLHISSFPGFKLTDEQSQVKLVNYCKRKQPKLVILEAWYLIAGEIDENKATEVAPALDFIGQVSRDFGVAIVVSHHYNKDAGTPGQKKRSSARVSGSSVFGRWYESAVFIERHGEEDEYAARMEAQHREQKGIGRLELQFEMDVEDEDNYAVTIIDKESSNVKVTDPARVEVDLPEPTPATMNDRKAVWAVEKAMKLSGEPVPVAVVARDVGMEWKAVLAAVKAAGYAVGRSPVGVGGREVLAVQVRRVRRGGIRQVTAGSHSKALRGVGARGGAQNGRGGR